MRHAWFGLVFVFAAILALAGVTMHPAPDRAHAAEVHDHGSHHLPGQGGDPDHCSGPVSCVSAPVMANEPSDQPRPRSTAAVVWPIAEQSCGMAPAHEADPPPPRTVS